MEMNRTKQYMVQITVIFCFVLISISNAAAASSSDPTRNNDLDHNPMQYAIIGQHYQAMVPDSLDLAKRMELAINALTNAWFPDEKWALGFKVDFSRRPPYLFINHATDAYLNIPPKFIEALVLCRLGSGSTQNIDVDLNVLKAQLSFLGDDCLTYTPDDTLDRLYDKELLRPDPYAEIWGEGRMLSALAMLAQIDDDPRWIEIGKRKVDRLLGLSNEKEDFRYFSTGRFYPGKIPDDAEEPTADTYRYMYSNNSDFNFKLIVAYSMGAAGHGSALFYRVTGYAPALELSGGLARWAMKRLFDNPDGRWTMYHFHHSLYALIAMCEYGIAAQDRDILERVDACYRWARRMGDPLIGFFPERMPGSKQYLQRQGNTVEICEVADMIWLALQLTRSGMGDYWDDVDRWTRNIFAQGQLINPGRLNQLPDSFFNTEPSNHTYQDTDNILQRSYGAFLGWMRANDGLCVVSDTRRNTKLKGKGIMHCCTGNGARTLYCVWDSIVSKSDDKVYINLLLNRISPWLDVASYLPIRGKVTVHIKDAETVNIRLPEWCDKENVKVRINDQIVKTTVYDRYLTITMLKPDDEVLLDFDVPQREVFCVLGEIPYKLILRGSDVIDIAPPGVAYPLFQNPPQGKLHKKTNFIPKIQSITW